MHVKYTSCLLLKLSVQMTSFSSGLPNYDSRWGRVAREQGLHNVCIIIIFALFKQSDHFHFFFFISSSFASFFLFRKASRSSKVWAPGMILEGLARGETLLLLFPPTA